MAPAKATNILVSVTDHNIVSAFERSDIFVLGDPKTAHLNIPLLQQMELQPTGLMHSILTAAQAFLAARLSIPLAELGPIQLIGYIDGHRNICYPDDMGLAQLAAYQPPGTWVVQLRVPIGLLSERPLNLALTPPLNHEG